MKDLLQRARSGDDEAFAALFQEQAQTLWKTALAVMRDEGKAADMLQETAVKAWRSIPTFDGASKLSTWLTRILLNACFDELRSQSKVIPFAEIAEVADGAAPVGSAGIAGSDALPTLEASTGDAGSPDHDTRLDVQATLGRLRSSDRLMLTMFYVNDMPVADIASTLGLSEGAVRTRLTRARTRFRDAYTQGNEACGDQDDDRNDDRAAERTRSLQALAEVAI